MVSGFLLLQLAFSVGNSYLSNTLKLMNSKLEYDLNYFLEIQILDKASSVPLAYFDNHLFHDHQQRASNNLGNRLITPINNLLDIGQKVISLTSFLFFLVNIHWLLAIFSTITSIPVLLMSMKFGKRNFSLMLYQTPRAREANYFKYLLGNKSVAKEVRIFNQKDYLLSRWKESYSKNIRQILSLMKSELLAKSGIDVFTSLIYTSISIILIFFNSLINLSIGQFVAILQIVQNTQVNINILSQSIGQIYKNLLFIQDLFYFLQYEDPRIRQYNDKKIFPNKLEKGITFRNVSFRYNNSDKYTLDSISYHIKPGEKIALVGNNGSGKTTLIKCLMGLYPIQNGEILFDNIPIGELDQETLRENITVIFQDYVKYNLTVKENIALGRINYIDNDIRVQDIAKKTGFDKLVDNLNQGYDTVLGKVLSEGEELSEGQWQNLCITRALFRSGQIYIFDEPTSSLDPQTEQLVYEKFSYLTKGKTAIFISHRMASARMADRIFVLNNGRLVEEGSHEELIAMNGEYSKLYHTQAKWYMSEKVV